jgi:hypothetical protein
MKLIEKYFDFQELESSKAHLNRMKVSTYKNADFFFSFFHIFVQSFLFKK